MEKIHNCPLPFGLSKPFMSCTRPERRDAAEHRRCILEVARRLFAELGVAAVSMHQIAVTAGIGQGTLYRRYAHKGELCMDILAERHERFAEEIASLFEATVAAPALERLNGVLARSLAFLEEQSALLGSMAVAEVPALRPNGPDESKSSHWFLFERVPFYLWLHDLFAGLLAEAVERGELAPLDISFTADAILAALNPTFYRFQRQERGYSLDRILQGLRHIYIEGV